MQIVFTQGFLSDLYYDQATDKKHRFQPEVVKKYIKVVNILKQAKVTICNLLDLSNHYQ